MHISATEEYGIRCLIQLARLEEGETLSATELAKREGLSHQYVSKLLFQFRQGGLVEATRGANGGFFLSRSPKNITLADVMEGSSPAKADQEFCDQFPGKEASCVHMENCSLRPVWHVLTDYVQEVLKGVYLSDLTGPEKDSSLAMRSVASREALKFTRE